MVRKVKEKYNLSFGKMAISVKGNNKFLQAVDLVLDWDAINSIFNKRSSISPYGASSYSKILLFKIILLQTWYNLTDPVVEEQINDRISFIKFLKISLDSQTPDHSTFNQATIENFKYIPSEYVKTFTSDNEKEFSGFKELEVELDVKGYFTNPYHSWERRTNENTNGLLRRYFPK